MSDRNDKNKTDNFEAQSAATDKLLGQIRSTFVQHCEEGGVLTNVMMFWIFQELMTDLILMQDSSTEAAFTIAALQEAMSNAARKALNEAARQSGDCGGSCAGCTDSGCSRDTADSEKDPNDDFDDPTSGAIN